MPCQYFVPQDVISLCRRLLPNSASPFEGCRDMIGTSKRGLDCSSDSGGRDLMAVTLHGRLKRLQQARPFPPELAIQQSWIQLSFFVVLTAQR